MKKLSVLFSHPAVKAFVFLTLFGIVVAGFSAVFNHFVAAAGKQILAPLFENPIETFAVYFLFAASATVLVLFPTMPIDLMLMTIFNPWLVLVIRVAASLAGASLNFTLGRRFGERILSRLMSRTDLEQVKQISKSVNSRHYFLIAMFPLTNPEIVAYAAGMSKIRIWELLPIMAVAMFYRLLIAVFIT
jgi:uncharacterized membrane protein YdjX (TVP38/TMEM64 family)